MHSKTINKLFFKKLLSRDLRNKMGESWQPADCVVLCLVWFRILFMYAYFCFFFFFQAEDGIRDSDM